MLQTCSKCKSKEVKDKTATLFFALTAILSLISTFLIFAAWPWSFLTIFFMLTTIVLAVALPDRKYKCKNCGHEWEGEYKTSTGEVTPKTVA